MILSVVIKVIYCCHHAFLLPVATWQKTFLAQLMIDSVSDFGYDNLNISMVFLCLLANHASQGMLYFT